VLKLVIKLNYAPTGELRRVPSCGVSTIHDLRLATLFGCQPESQALSWVDPDGDEVILTMDSELRHAIDCAIQMENQTLRLNVFPTKESALSHLGAKPVHLTSSSVQHQNCETRERGAAQRELLAAACGFGVSGFLEARFDRMPHGLCIRERPSEQSRAITVERREGRRLLRLRGKETGGWVNVATSGGAEGWVRATPEENKLVRTLVKVLTCPEVEERWRAQMEVDNPPACTQAEANAPWQAEGSETCPDEGPLDIEFDAHSASDEEEEEEEEEAQGGAGAIHTRWRKPRVDHGDSSLSTSNSLRDFDGVFHGTLLGELERRSEGPQIRELN